MLTAKQEAFAQAVASGMTQADAYRSAYDCGNSSDEVIWNNASTLMKHSEVSIRVAALKEATSLASLWTRLDSVQALADIARGGESKSNEIVAAVKELNMMHGFNAPTKIDVSGTFQVNVNFD